MDDEKRPSAPVGVGVLTILTVLVVLILAVFTALSLSEARGDLDGSRAAAGYTTAYYAADALAREAAEAFKRDSALELEQSFPVTERQELYIHLVRADGAIDYLAWQTRPVTGAGTEESLPIWDGTALPGAEG